MGLKQAAAREAILKTLLDAVKEEYDVARAETRDLLEAAAKETGVRQVAVSLPEGPDVATVSMSGGSAEAKVTDVDAFTSWVVANFASEVERKFLTVVRESFTKKLLAELNASGTTEYADPATGVIHDVPGVAIAPTRARTHSIRFKKEGRDQVMHAWREGRLTGVVLPQLTAAPAEETA
jgi:hypothetical protein